MSETTSTEKPSREAAAMALGALQVIVEEYRSNHPGFQAAHAEKQFLVIFRLFSVAYKVEEKKA